MRLITTIPEMRTFSRQIQAAGKSLALVPTMGALHDGHLSLVRHAQRQCDAVVVSIFVNPLQFGPGEDLNRYPRSLEGDCEILRTFNIEAVFAPAVAEMYPEGFETFVTPGEVAASLEGGCRPGHFRGVATVVLKLFNIVRPQVAYFGQKDFQQTLVIRRMVEELNLDVRLILCPIVRDADGLAKSSRTVNLKDEERSAARALYRSLERAEGLVQAGQTDAANVLDEMRAVLAREKRVQLDYVALVEPARLQPVERVTAGCVALVAAKVGPTRLIDNTIFGPPGSSPELRLQMALASTPVLDVRARIPGLETDALRKKIEACRDCAAINSILLPPREFLVKYLKRDYPDLNAVRVLVIGRDAPINPENFVYRKSEMTNRFVTGLMDLTGVKTFQEFKQRLALTDALRCHASGSRVPEKALEHCARHLREELKLFPNLVSVVALGPDACLQFQRFVLGRNDREVKPFNQLLGAEDWAREDVQMPSHRDRTIRVFYCHHPTYEYKRSPSLGSMLA